jgi:curved DNA-binding protein CbpA
MDLYEILELKPTASNIEIKKAYHRLVKLHHPDKNNSATSTEKFQKIQSAYEILINDKSRQEYQKMNQTERFSFVEILEKIIKENINISEITKYGIELAKLDFDYIQKNFINFFKAINVSELLDFFKKGIVPRKTFNTAAICSESDNDIYDESCAEYYYNLPISYQKINNLDINIELNIKIGDIANINKRKIKLKRNINNVLTTSTFIFNMSSPYIVFIGAGDLINNLTGNLIIKLNLPTNYYWNENIIVIEQSMSLYEMIYGIDIFLELGNDKNINIQNWVPSRDGYVVDITTLNKNVILSNYNLAIKLFLDYEDTPYKKELLKANFS